MLIAHLKDKFPNYTTVSPPIGDLHAFYKVDTAYSTTIALIITYRSQKSVLIMILNLKRELTLMLLASSKVTRKFAKVGVSFVMFPVKV